MSRTRTPKGRPSFAEARAQYVHRFTMEHVPAWASQSVGGRHYAPQFRTDLEWFENSRFPGEPGIHGNNRHCETTGQTWPLGQWLEAPYRRAA